jgi:hypothetical protein
VWQELDYCVDVCHVTEGAHIEHLWMSVETWRVSLSCYVCIGGINPLQQSQLCFLFVPFILNYPTMTVVLAFLWS